MSDVIIGSGKEGVTTITVFTIPGLSTLSSNKNCFRAECVLGINATIFRDTPEGKTLQEMIDSNQCASDIQNFLDSSVLRAVDFDLFKYRLERYAANSYEKGYRHAQKRMRSALGMIPENFNGGTGYE